ncbi:MAG: methylglyoxal synthase [Clostridiaceae bacterium]|nr:methylglyoxal synthase [Clostridiaceae bacterium]
MVMDDYIHIPIPRQKTIALIAHDNKKEELVSWVKDNLKVLRKHFLCGTGTTSRIISEETDLPVKSYNSGPLGGDQQIGSRIVEGRIDMVIFFWDPLAAQPHDPDVKALLRIAAVYDIPIANNRATADFIISSTLMDEEYDRKIINYNKKMIERVSKFKDK